MKYGLHFVGQEHGFEFFCAPGGRGVKQGANLDISLIGNVGCNFPRGEIWDLGILTSIDVFPITILSADAFLKDVSTLNQ